MLEIVAIVMGCIEVVLLLFPGWTVWETYLQN